MLTAWDANAQQHGAALFLSLAFGIACFACWLERYLGVTERVKALLDFLRDGPHA